MKNTWQITNQKHRETLKGLTSEQLRKFGTDVGVHPDVLDIDDLVIDIGAEYVTDSPELEKFIPVKQIS